jgi:UDP-glucuronate 4-epimerase
MDFIHILEATIGKEAILEMHPMQKGDIKTTFADTTEFEKVIGYKPTTDLKEGIEKFIEWCREFDCRYGFL